MFPRKRSKTVLCRESLVIYALDQIGLMANLKSVIFFFSQAVVLCTTVTVIACGSAAFSV